MMRVEDALQIAANIEAIWLRTARRMEAVGCHEAAVKVRRETAGAMREFRALITRTAT